MTLPRATMSDLWIEFANAITSPPTNDPMATQIQALKVEYVRKLLDQINAKDGAAARFSGSAVATNASSTIGEGNGAANGAAPTIADMARLVGLVTASEICDVR